MKKLLSFTLVLAMILGSVSMVFAGNVAPADVIGEDCQEAVNVLTGLGVIEGYEQADGTYLYKPEGSITRAEAVKLVIAALNMPVDENASYTTPFTDANNHWANPYIYYAYTLGITEGTSATTFSPNAKVTNDQMITFILRALGYNEECLNGTYPACYVSKAVGLKILKDNLVSGNGAANRGDCAQFLYNALECEVGKVDKDGTWVAQAGPNAFTPDSMLVRLGAEEVPQATYAADPAAVAVGSKFGLLVDEALIEDEDTLIDLNDYLGAVCTFYLDDDNQIVALNEVLTEKITGKYQLSDSGVYTIAGYKTQGNAPWTGLGAGTYADFINGGLANAAAAPTTVNATTNLTLWAYVKSNKVQEVYSRVRTSATLADFITEDDLDDIADDHQLWGVQIVENEDDEIDMTKLVLNGVDSIDEIAEGDVVYAYRQAGNGDIVRLDVSNKTVSGVVSKITEATSDNAAVKFTVDGTAYGIVTTNNNTNDTDFDGKYFKAAGDRPAVDTDIKAYLGFDGKLFYWEANENKSDYAIFLAKSEGDVKVGSALPTITVFTAEGKKVTYDVEYKTGSTIVEKTNVFDAAGAQGDAGTKYYNAIGTYDTVAALDVVKLTVNSKDQVTAITIVGSATFAAGSDISSKGIVTGNGTMDADTVVFSFSGDVTDADDHIDAANWAVASYKTICGLDAADYKGFFIDEDGDGAIDVAIVGDSVVAGQFVVITAYSAIADGKEVTVLEDGATGTYDADDTAMAPWALSKDTQKAYKLLLDAEGNVSEVQALTAGTNVNATYFGEGIALGTTASTFKNGIFTYYTGAANQVPVADDFSVYVFDISDKKWTVGSASTLKGLNNEVNNVISYYSTNMDDSEEEVDLILVF